MSPIRYRNGLELQVFCHRCQSKVRAVIYQQRIRWIAKLSCPHGTKHMGYTMPQDELIKKNLASSDNPKNDPRVEEARAVAQEDIKVREQEIRDFHAHKETHTNAKFF